MAMRVVDWNTGQTDMVCTTVSREIALNGMEVFDADMRKVPVKVFAGRPILIRTIVPGHVYMYWPTSR